MDLKCLVYLFAVFCLIQSESDQEVPERIVGGKLCELKQFPYVVYLSISHNVVGNPRVCTGSIIAGKWVLTSARTYRHITDKGGDPDKTVTKVIAGAVDRNAKNEEMQERTSVRHIVHERYPEHDKESNNIALVEVGQPFNFNVFVDKITMAKFPRGAEKLPCSSVGYGLTSPTLPIISYRMYYISTRVNDCETKRTYVWGDDYLCAYPVKEGTSTCGGDWGGPLVYGHIQIGVQNDRRSIENPSITPPCGANNTFDVYLKVSIFEDWIRQHVPEISPMEQWPVGIKKRSEKRSSASSATVAGVSVLTIAFWLSILVGSDHTSA